MSTIKGIAYLNELTKDVLNDHYVLHEPVGTLYESDIIKRLERKQIATNNVNGAAFVKTFHDECILALSEGYNVITGLCNISIGIKGVVYTHQLGRKIPANQLNVRMNCVQSAEARRVISTMTVQVAEQSAATGPVVQSVENPLRHEAGKVNTGAMVLVQGMRLAIQGDRKDEIGVFFTKADDESMVVRVPEEHLSPNTPTRLQFVLPAEVTPGEWMVAVATQYSGSGGKYTVNVRRYEFMDAVIVE